MRTASSWLRLYRHHEEPCAISHTAIHGVGMITRRFFEADEKVDYLLIFADAAADERLFIFIFRARCLIINTYHMHIIGVRSQPFSLDRPYTNI